MRMQMHLPSLHILAVDMMFMVGLYMSRVHIDKYLQFIYNYNNIAMCNRMTILQ